MLGVAWRMLPPEVRKSWATIPTLVAEMSPGAGAHDLLHSSGDLARSTMNLDPWGARRVPRRMGRKASHGHSIAHVSGDQMFPMTVYHGTAGDVRAFGPARKSQNFLGPVSGAGISVSTDPRVASHFAPEAGGRQAERIAQARALGEKVDPNLAGPSVMPLRLDPGEMGTLTLTGKAGAALTASVLIQPARACACPLRTKDRATRGAARSIYGPPAADWMCSRVGATEISTLCPSGFTLRPVS